MKVNLSIAFKFSAGMILILFGIFAFFYAYFPAQVKSKMLEKELLNAGVLIDVVSVGAGAALSTDDFYVLSLTINTAKQFPNVDYIVFLDNTDDQVAVYNPQNLSIDKSLYPMSSDQVISEDHLLIKSPLFYGDKRHGSLLLKYSLNNLNRIVKDYERTILMSSLAIMFIGSFFGVLLARMVTAPIKKLMKASNQVSLGDLDVNVEVRSRDEMGVLAEAFNYMIKNIKENNIKIENRNEELLTQQAEMEEQNQELQASEEELRVQQEELTEANEELEETSRQLEEKNQFIYEKNHELEQAYKVLNQKVEELDLAGKYKSEFLSNMSHELRTPLNSILLLSKLLANNPQKTLDEDEVESAKVIHSAGKGLLELINEILDLSKIESGKMSIEPENVLLEEVRTNFILMFKHVADESGVELKVLMHKGLPKTIFTDKLRLEQVLKNFSSNAFKFTKRGSVSLEIFPGKTQLPGHKKCIGFAVKDTGIGIPIEKQQVVFEAFQQADGSTQREFGGTGLGLSISKEIVRLLGGIITLESEPGKGSNFTFYIPYSLGQKQEEKIVNVNRSRNNDLLTKEPPIEIPDDRDNIGKSDQVILIIERDTHFASQLLKIVRDKGYKGIVDVMGDQAISLAEKIKVYGIISEIKLPKADGLTILDNLKSNPQTRHIPVHIVSSMDADKQVFTKGAIEFSQKPMDIKSIHNAIAAIEDTVSNRSKKVLVIEYNNMHRKALTSYLKENSVSCQSARTAEEALNLLGKDKFYCIVLDMMLPDESSYQFFEQIRNNPKYKRIPVIVYIGKRRSEMEEIKIGQFSSAIVMKTAESYQRLLNEITLFLHINKGNGQKRKPQRSTNQGEVLKGKKVLIADDDVRTVHSMTRLLEQTGMQVVSVKNGREVLEKLNHRNQIDVILMDIMMPVMDGLETMVNVRKIKNYENTPMIAITAKAMSGDRKKCIKAGASDYISKPVDADQLISLLRVWLHK